MSAPSLTHVAPQCGAVPTACGIDRAERDRGGAEASMRVRMVAVAVAVGVPAAGGRARGALARRRARTGRLRRRTGRLGALRGVRRPRAGRARRRALAATAIRLVEAVAPERDADRREHLLDRTDSAVGRMGCLREGLLGECLLDLDGLAGVE